MLFDAGIVGKHDDGCNPRSKDGGFNIMADVYNTTNEHDPSLVDGLDHEVVTLSETQLEHLQWAKDFLKKFDAKYKKRYLLS